MATTAQLIARYGNPVKDQNSFVKKWMVMYTLPVWLLEHFPKAYNGVHVTRIYMNKEAQKPFEAVMHDLVCTGLIKELKSYDGCWNVRNMRGTSVPSVHSWGLAFDFNAKLNPLGVKWGSRPGMFSKSFLDVWAKHGWTVGAYFGGGRSDAMHFQYTKPAE